MKPRDYQLAGVDALFRFFATTWGHPLLVYPTGTGKSVVIAEFIRRALRMYPYTRVLVLTHVKELIEQNFKKLLRMWPTAPAGVYSAGLGRKDIGAQVTFAGIASIANAVALFGHINLIIIDEAHLVSDNDATQYRQLIAALQEVNPNLKVIGLTATEYRLSQGMLTEPGGIFTHIALNLGTVDGFLWFINNGYLVPLVPPGVPLQTQYDISNVPIGANGDYKLGALGKAVDRESLTRSAIEETLAHGADRLHWLAFTSNIQHTIHTAQYLNEYGISALAVHSHTKEFPYCKGRRDEAVKAYKMGHVQCLVNNGVFTTGFDFPGIDLIMMLRHTTSPGLWVQMLGRGTRPMWPTSLEDEKEIARNHHRFPGYYPGMYDLEVLEHRLACIAAGKPNTLVMDFAKNTERLGPINNPNKPHAKGKRNGDAPGDAPVKMCSSCNAYNWASARICYVCAGEFSYVLKIESSASNKELIQKEKVEKDTGGPPVEEWFEVTNMTFNSFKAWNGKKRNSRGQVPNMLAVTYHCGPAQAFIENVRLEDDGVLITYAHKWWREMCLDDVEPPATVEESRNYWDRIRQPKRIRVWMNKKPMPQVQYREF